MASGKLASANVASAASDTLIYTVPAGKIASCTVCLTNRNTTSTNIRIAITSAASVSDSDYVEYDTMLLGNGVLERGGLVLGAGEKVYVRSSVAGVSVRVQGFEE